MVPPPVLDDEATNAPENKTPPLVMLHEVKRAGNEWVVIYHFFYGPLDGHFTMALGPLAEMDEAAATARALSPDSSQLSRARLALLQALTLETMH